MTRRRRFGRPGMTLIELLVVMAVVGVLVSLMLPAIQTAREAARRIACQNQLRQIGLALSGYESAHAEYPTGCVECRVMTPRPRFISWLVPLLPYLEEAPLHASINLGEPMYSPENRAAGMTVITTLLCPSTSDARLTQPTGLWRDRAFTDFGGLYGVEGPGNEADNPASTQTLADRYLGVMLYEQPTRVREVTDGTTHTAIVAEMLHRRQSECEWINGHQLFAQEKSTAVNGDSGLGNDIGGPHTGGAYAAFCDGHVGWISDTTNQATLVGWMTKAGGERSKGER